jgi:hypothetical protein
MNKTLLAASMLALFGTVQPASAMMCGSGQQTQASGNTVSSGMMCGAMGQGQDDPMADKPAHKQQSGMCPCCRNMAMMRGSMMGGGMMGGGMQHHDMPSMEKPKQ